MVKPGAGRYLRRVGDESSDERREKSGADGAAVAALYRERVMTHARAPRNFGTLEGATRRVEGHNPLCGDRVTMAVFQEGERIVSVRFEGAGCALSIASASMATEALGGREREAARALVREAIAALEGRSAADERVLGEAVALTAVSAFPARLKCVTLAWQTLDEALAGED